MSIRADAEASQGGFEGCTDDRLSTMEWGVFVIVSVANLIPIWAFRYFAGQDTPNHLYGGAVLLALRDGSASPLMERTFVAILGLKSNVAFHALLLVLAHCGLSLELAHRLILSLYSVTFPLAALFCARTVAPRSQPLALLFLPLTWNWFALQGLYNYILSLVAGLVWLAIVARDGGRPRRGASFALALASITVYLCHVGTFLVLMLVSALRVGAPVPNSPKALRDRLISAGPIALALAPAMAVACIGMFTALRGGLAPPEPTLSAWEPYSVPEAAGAFFVEFAMRYRLADLVVLGLPLLLLMIAPLKAASQAKYETSSADPMRSTWPIGAAAILTALYFVLPHIVFGSDLSPRLRPLVLFCLFCYGGVTLSLRARRAVSGVALLSGLSSVALLCLSFTDLNRQLGDFTSGIPFVRRGARLYPMVFDPRSPSLLVKPFLHAWAYYGVEGDIVSPFAFAWHPARFPYRYRDLPIHGRSGPLPSDSEDEPYALTDGRLCNSVRRLAPSRTCEEIRGDTEDRLARLGQSYDYVLTWKAPSDFSRLLLARGYSVLHAQGAMILYRPSTGATAQSSSPSI
jgi:hypothetical protein